MRSVSSQVPSTGRAADADLTATARIRQAALELFGERGFDRTTVRAIAERAGVSAGLVLHHFGSKDGLRSACDSYVSELFDTEAALVASHALARLASYADEHPELGPVTDYIVAALRDGGPAAEAIFDRLVEHTERMYDEAVPTGALRRPSDARATVAVLVAYSAGAAILGDHLARHLGGERLYDEGVYQRYGLASVELLTQGMFPDTTVLDQLRESLRPTEGQP